jgi:hypothetical protein
MGSRSRSSNTSGATSSTMNGLSKGKVSNESMMNLLNGFQNSQMGVALPIFGGMMEQGNQVMMNHPMFGLMRQMGIMPEQPQVAQQPQPELSPYEQRLQVLMNDKGMSREDAIANQQNAMRLGTDYNNDGAVTNDEWAKFQQTPEGMAYENRGTAPQPQIAPRTQTVPPGMGFYGVPRARGGMR